MSSLLINKFFFFYFYFLFRSFGRFVLVFKVTTKINTCYFKPFGRKYPFCRQQNCSYTGWPVIQRRVFLASRKKWLVQCTRVKLRGTSHFLQVTRKSRPCLSGQVARWRNLSDLSAALLKIYWTFDLYQLTVEYLASMVSNGINKNVMPVILV